MTLFSFGSDYIAVLWIRIRIRRIHTFLDLYFVQIRIRILPLTSKKMWKTVIATILCLLFDFLSMKTYL